MKTAAEHLDSAYHSHWKKVDEERSELRKKVASQARLIEAQTKRIEELKASNASRMGQGEREETNSFFFNSPNTYKATLSQVK